MLFVIGSTAMNYWYPESRKPKDYDVYSTTAAIASRISVSDGPGDVFRHKNLGNFSWMTYAHPVRGVGCVLNPDALYTVKHSHAYWDLKNGSWGKHMHDLLFLKNRGAQLIPEMHDHLYKIWEDVHGKKQVDLSMEKQEFFADAVVRKYDHDSLHDSVAFGERPLYERILKDGHSVAVDMKKLKALPYEDQIKLFREEVYATALERVLVPQDYQISPGFAYLWALRRTITSLTKGWSAKFMVSNFERFANIEDNYLARHLHKSHLLIPLKEKS